MNTQPYYIAPLLIEQPTWGGEYIANFKGLSADLQPKTKIGQSYELAKDSLLIVGKPREIPFLLASATDTQHPKWIGPKTETLKIEEVVEMPLLNKFTQAKENSYQTHVRPGAEFGNWQPKPESWYYFEKGKATLGLKPETKVAEYKKRCEEIYQYSLEISRKIKTKKLTLQQAKKKLQEFIDKDHPQNYVNTVYPQKDQIVDLSACGIHHSWQADSQLPNGNIVYEVQLDVRDEVSSLRAFDQGKIKTDGSLRKLTLEEYFRALNSNPSDNQPEQYMQLPTSKVENNAQITKVFENPHYQLTQIEFLGEYKGEETQVKTDFHHLFVKEGQGEIMYQGERWPLSQGWSIFIPASCKKYTLNSTQKAQVLKTTR